MNELKANHSYLVKRTEYTGQSEIPVKKITVLTVTQTCYEIQWENTKTWEEISDFDPRITIVEDLGEVKDSRRQTWEEIKKELEKMKKKFEPYIGDPPKRDPFRPWIKPWRIDDPKRYRPAYPDDFTTCWKSYLNDTFGIRVDDPESPAMSWFRGHAEKLKREGYL